MPVYFIVECGNLGKALRIGWASNIQKRRQNLQIGKLPRVLTDRQLDRRR